jgi:hypothetical protein
VGTGSFSNFGTLINTGGLSSENSPIVNSGTVLNYGNIGGPSDFAFINNAGSLFVNYGNIAVTVAGFYSNSGTFVNVSGGTLESDSGGGVLNSGVLINEGEQANLGFGFLNNSGTLINNGVLTNGSVGDPDLGVAGFTNSGGFFNAGTFKNSGTMNNTGTFLNSGAVTVFGTGLITTSTNYTQIAGSTLVNGTLTTTNGAIVNIQGGTLGGSGMINGNVVMGGTITPGDAPSTLAIVGNYEQTGTGIFDELLSSHSQSFLDVSGNVTLDPGSLLEITLLGGFDPLGQTFALMDFNNLTGEFASGSSFSDDGFLWDVTYFQHSIDVTAVQSPEPRTVLLLVIGLFGLISYGWRRSSCLPRHASNLR